jgi:hypothetical protein
MHIHSIHQSIRPSSPDSPLPIQIVRLSNRKPGSKFQHGRSNERQRCESTCRASTIYRLLSDFGKGRVVLDDQVREVDVVSDGSTMRREGVKVTVRFDVRGRDRSRAKNKEGTGTISFRVLYQTSTWLNRKRGRRGEGELTPGSSSCKPSASRPLGTTTCPRHS